MASRFDEQPAAGMGRREEGARRAQAYRTNGEGAPRGTKYTGDSRDARSSRRHQKSAARGMDVLWALSWTNRDHRGNGGVSVGQEKNRWADQGYGEQEAREGVYGGIIHGFAERKHCQGYGC